MSNRTSIRLGRKSIAALVEYLEPSETWATLRQFLFKHGLEARFSGPNKLAALGQVFYRLAKDDADEEELRRAREAFEELTQGLYQTIKAHEDDEFSVPGYQYQRSLTSYQTFQLALRADGLDLIEGRISPFLSPSVAPAQEQGVLEMRLRNLGFTASQRHLEQAIDNAARGNWEAANSQVRAFLESLCEAIAERIHRGPGAPPTRGLARQYLEGSGFLTPEEAEFLKAFFKVLHTAGGHAGASTEDDCHRRRLMALSLANYYLDRLT